MKIIRNGVEIELTSSELHQAHDECSHYYTNEDILSKINERLEDDPNNQILISLVNDFDKKINTALVKRVENALSKNDSYYEAYWCTIDYVLDEIIKEKNNYKGEK